MTLFDEGEQSKPAAPEGPLVRVRATVAYDGSGFAGFAAQPLGVRTVAGALSSAIAKVLGHPIELTCAGRTDAGVHGWGQVVSFDASAERFDAKRLQRSVNKQLGPGVVLRSVAAADAAFDARFSATARCYRYTVVNDPVADPFLASTAWWVPQPLDLRLLRLACDPLIGEHDFSSFCRRGEGSMVRRVRAITFTPRGDELIVKIKADSFCHQMVRSIVGLLLEVGAGKREPEDVGKALRAKHRNAAGPIAAARGLHLIDVGYPRRPFERVDRVPSPR